MLEEALHKRHAVAMAAAVGKPDEQAGELPVVYLQFKPGAQARAAELLAHAAEHIPERAAIPKDAWIIEAIPLTAVGKTVKPTLRFDAIGRVYPAAPAELDQRLRGKYSLITSAARSPISPGQPAKPRGLTPWSSTWLALLWPWNCIAQSKQMLTHG
jgi:hypothetical protein